MSCSGCSALHGVNPYFKKKNKKKTTYLVVEDYCHSLKRGLRSHIQIRSPSSLSCPSNSGLQGSPFQPHMIPLNSPNGEMVRWMRDTFEFNQQYKHAEN